MEGFSGGGAAMKALVLKAPGTNRDYDVAEAIEYAGGTTVLLPLSELRERPALLLDYGMLVIPGGFSYGDALGAGKLLALDFECFFAEAVMRFVEEKRPVLGICNGFQALIKTGILPGAPFERHTFTLAQNARGNFECRWVRLRASTSNSIWTRGIEGFSCPVAHGEGRFASSLPNVVESLRVAGCIALEYANERGEPAQGCYPDNPNGSIGDIAGICNSDGNVLGLMPHPENAVFPWQSASMPGWAEDGALRLFRNGIEYARS